MVFRNFNLYLLNSKNNPNFKVGNIFLTCFWLQQVIYCWKHFYKYFIGLLGFQLYFIQIHFLQWYVKVFFSWWKYLTLKFKYGHVMLIFLWCSHFMNPLISMWNILPPWNDLMSKVFLSGFNFRKFLDAQEKPCEVLKSWPQNA